MESDNEDDEKEGVDKGDKLHKKFTFCQDEHLNRAVTSIDWSP